MANAPAPLPASPRLGSLPLHITLLALAALWSLPTVGLLVTSLRPPDAITTTGWWTVFQHPLTLTQYYLGNYLEVVGRSGMGQAFRNSLLISIPATLLPLALATCAAYALACLSFPGRRLWFGAIVGLLVVPLQTTLIPVLKAYGTLGLSGTFLAVWLAHTGYGLPFGIYLLRNYMAALPRDLLEAAAVDGASSWTTFTRLVLPLSIPAIASFGVFQFLWVWNDLLVALVYLGGSKPVAPLTLALRNLVGDRGQDWHLLTAGAFVSMGVPLVVFFLLQRYFVRGILAGSLKG